MANQAEIDRWIGESGENWLAMEQRLSTAFVPFAEAVVDAAAPSPGQRVLDVGCGTGPTTTMLAERVGPTGHVLGVDVSPRLLAVARDRIGDRAEFIEADAQTFAFERGTFDVVASRFGVMFFDDPVAAFSNLRAALRSRGRMAFVCWQAITRNLWMWVPLQVVLQHVTADPPGFPPPPGAPGPFALADESRLGSILNRAGFDDIVLRAFEPEVVIGAGDLNALASNLMLSGPMRMALGAVDATIVDRVRQEVVAAIAPYETSVGVVMPTATWVVTAVNPG